MRFDEMADIERDLIPENVSFINQQPRVVAVPFSADLDPILDDTWLVEDVLPDQGFGVMYGPPGCGKTFLMLDIAFAVAGAKSAWNGKFVEPRGVLYCGMEGGRKFGNRVAAYARERGEAPHFYRSSQNLDFRSNHRDADAIIVECRRLSDIGKPVGLIVVDTLSRALAGGDENGPADMGQFVAVCEKIRKAVGCFLMVVHHSGKDAGRGARGHTALLGAVDTELALERSDNNRSITVTKQRDGDDGASWSYALRPVHLGYSNPRNRPVTSCVVDYDTAQKPKVRLAANQAKAAEALRQMVDDLGQPCPGGTGWPPAGSLSVVSLPKFIEFLAAKMSNPELSDRVRTARRAVDDLQRKNVAQINQDHIWIIPEK